MSGRFVCSRFRKQQLLPVVTCLLLAMGFFLLPVSCKGRAPKPQQLLQADDAGTGALGDESSPREETRRKLLLRGMGGMGRGGGFRSASRPGLRQRFGSSSRPAGMPGYMPPAQAQSRAVMLRNQPGRSTTPFAGRWRPAALDRPSKFRSSVGAAARQHRVSSLLPLVAGAHMFRGSHSRNKQPQTEDADGQLQQAAEGGPGNLNHRPVTLDARTALHSDEKAAHEKLHGASNDMRNRVLGKPVVMNPEQPAHPMDREESGTE